MPRLKALLAPLTLPVRAGPLAGKRLSVVSGSRLLLGRYEPEKTEAFARSIEKGAFVIDVGAHYGYFSLIAAQLAGAGGLVWAFEPRPSNLRILRINLSANDLSANDGETVVVWERAVSSASGTPRFDTRHGSGTGRLSEGGDIEVSAVALDDLSLPRAPSLIKIDIEGGEVDALAGAARTIEAHRPKLLVAVHGAARRRQVEAMLTEWGYGFSTLNPHAVKGDTELLATPR